MNRWYEFEINVTLKVNRGSFGVKRERHTFHFCAHSREDAVELACGNVPSQGYPFDEREFQVLSCVLVERETSDECLYGDHDLCTLRWCGCVHHSEEQFRLEHPQLRSLLEVA